MQLLQLPPESLRDILSRLEASFFCEDLGRLSICKLWFELVLPLWYRHILLTRRAIRAFVSSGIIETRHSLIRSLQTLELDLRIQWQSTSSLSIYNGDDEPMSPADQISNDEPVGDRPSGPSWNSLYSDLAALAILAKRSYNLKSLRIHAGEYAGLQHYNSPEVYPSDFPLKNFLAAESLRVLVLDLPGSFSNLPGQEPEIYHMCPKISSILCTLQTLHIRMRTICPDVLKPQTTAGNLRLSDVVVNLSLTSDVPSATGMAHSRRCTPADGGFTQLKRDLQEQAEVLATRMASPGILRILTHSLPQLEVHSLDVLTRRTMILEDGMAWDAEGKPVVEYSEPESELLDDDLSDFTD